MLLEIAILDSYGAGREYSSPTIVGEDFYNPTKYISHKKWHQRPGLYTDDTAMAIAVAEVLIEKNIWATKLDYANKFVEVFHRDQVEEFVGPGEKISYPRKGYAGGFYDFMTTVKDGEDMLARIKPDSDKSGAAMRSGPLGVIRNIDALLKVAEVHGKITHDTPDGIEAAQASALMSHFCVYNLGKREQIGEFVEGILGPRLQWNTDYVGKVGIYGWASTRAAITAIKKHDNLQDIMMACVAFTGDVDTAAAIAGSCSAHPDVVKNLDPALYSCLENGKYGHDFLVELDAKLMKLVLP